MPSQESDSELVRRGIIDVESLDENDDRHLYEFPMDWNVLSDDKYGSGKIFAGKSEEKP